MAGLVADLSELSLLQARPPSALGPVDLAAVADDVVHRATAMAESAGVRLETAAGVPGHAVIVRGDRDRIVQVALILLDNTIRHSPRGSTVHVAVTPVRGGGELSVADQGPGIAPADRERIFEPFARLASATDRSQGSGLGLAIARAIVCGMSGRIRVADASGGGALFTVTLPSP
jgi:signal transduction histidine kinase